MYEIFRQLLQENKLSANKFATIVGISQSTLSDWKRNVSVPKTDKLQIIASYFDVSIDYLLGKTDIKKQPPTRELSNIRA